MVKIGCAGKTIALNCETLLKWTTTKSFLRPLLLRTRGQKLTAFIHDKKVKGTIYIQYTEQMYQDESFTWRNPPTYFV